MKKRKIYVKTGYQDFIDEQLQDRDEFWEDLNE